MVQRIGKVRSETECGDSGGGESGDKFAADAMARIVAGLKNCHRHAGAAERESERKSGQAAADDFDGPGEGHGRRMAIRR